MFSVKESGILPFKISYKCQATSFPPVIYIFCLQCIYGFCLFEKFSNMLDTTSPNRTYWRLIELPYWFHPGFWPKVLGILET